MSRRVAALRGRDEFVPGDAHHPARGPFSRILVAVDGSPASESAARLAISLARGNGGAELVFCHAIDVHRMLVQADRYFDDFPFLLGVARAVARDVLDRCCALAREAGVFGRSFLRAGKPAEEVLRLADALGADLVVMGNRPCSKLHRVLRGSVRDEMLRWSTRPILAADVDPSRPVDFRPSCILAPVEDSSASLRAARLAAAIAKAYATRLVLVRPGGVPSLGASMWSRAIERAVVEHRPSLIVMGVARSRGLRSLFSSSVVERVLQEAQAPLLVVHE